MQDFSSPTRNQTHAPCSGRVDQEIPQTEKFLKHKHIQKHTPLAIGVMMSSQIL